MLRDILQHFLTSDMKSFVLSSKVARHNKVWLTAGTSRLSEWRIIPIPKKFRMELEHTPVPVSFMTRLIPVKLCTFVLFCSQLQYCCCDCLDIVNIT